MKLPSLCVFVSARASTTEAAIAMLPLVLLPVRPIALSKQWRYAQLCHPGLEN
jgi:hypothetical protein